jgi:glycosyltransferase involved in cell wall biosynthesis
MRILITTTQVPFIFGGAEVHALSLKKALIERGHEADISFIPFKWYPAVKIMDHLMACRLLDLTESCGNRIDRVIGLKFPAYHVPHPDKTLWILHQYRGAFDLWGTDACDLSHDPEGREIREGIRHLERQLLQTEVRAIHANSQNVSNRLREHCQIDGPPLYHPPQNAERFYCAEAEAYFYYPSRLCTLKRQTLLIEALALTQEPVKLVFSGQTESESFAQQLYQRIETLGLKERVQFLGRVSDETMWETYARARGIVFVPKDEDYGYISLEAMLSSKPVITCKDSGGPLEFITHEENGLVCESTPESLASALDRAWREPVLMREMGLKGRERFDAAGINWDTVVNRLLQ